MALQPGQSLQQYRLTGKIGEGGMGVVWKATDTSLDREVAIKVLPETVAGDAERLARFQREARVLASLSHPHIASLFGLHHAGDVHFLAMELVPGEDLSQCLGRGRMSVAETLEIARQIAAGLEAAHENGVVHRDLKPANIRITPEGQAKVLDFGLAKPFDTEKTTSSGNLTHSPTITAFGTAAGIILGTAGYMSPEQARGRPVDRRADIWAFGCVLYEMLTGISPFAGDTVTDTLAAVVRGDPDWQALPADAPSNVVSLLHRCLDKDPQSRLRDIGEARILLSGPLDSSHAGVATPIDQSTRPANRRAPVLMLAAATVILAALTALLGFRLLWAPAPPAPMTLRFQVTPPDDSILRPMGDKAAPAEVSPDGQKMVFGVRETSGENRLWIRFLNDPEPRALDRTHGGSRPFWSPDSRSLAFFAGGELRRLEIDGGPAIFVAPADSGRGGTWNQNDVIVFSPSAIGPLSKVNASGGEVQEITHLESKDSSGSHRYPHFLPDGEHFLFLALTGAGASGVEPESQQRTYIGSLDGSEPRLLMQGTSNTIYAGGHLLFLRGEHLQAQRFNLETLQTTGQPVVIARGVQYDRGYEKGIFSAADATLAYQGGSFKNESELNWYSRDGQTSSALAATSSQGNPILSPDGRVAAFYSSETGAINIWLYDFQTELKSRFTLEEGQHIMPLWSPDGSRLFYASSSIDSFNISARPVSGGGEPELILDLERGVYPQDLSPDGRYLVYLTPTAGELYDIWTLDLQGGERRPLITSERYTERLAQVSPDGRWIAYTSDESGRNEVYVAPFPSAAGKQQVSRSGGLEPRWNPDGSSIFFRDLFSSLMETRLLTSADSLEVGQEKTLFQFHGYATTDIGDTTYDVTPDGKRFLVNTVSEEQARQPISVVANWQTALTPPR